MIYEQVTNIGIAIAAMPSITPAQAILMPSVLALTSVKSNNFDISTIGEIALAAIATGFA